MPHDDEEESFSPPFVRSISIKAIREDARECDFVASTDDIDSYDEIVEQKWNLDRYNRNPVILFAHKSRELPIGQSVRHQVVNGQLETTIRFASEAANPLAEQVWQSVKERTLRTVSVGFNPQSMRWEMRDGHEVCVLSDNELYEISVTPIPANPNAVAKAKQRALRAAPRGVSGATETDPMTITKEEAERLEKSIQDKTKELDAERARAKDLADKLEAEQAAHVKVKADLDEVSKAKKLVDAEVTTLRAECNAAKVDLLIEQNKILPAERDEYIELAATSASLFERMTKNRKAHAITTPVVGVDPTNAGERVTSQKSADEQLDEEMFEKISRGSSASDSDDDTAEEE